MKCDRSARSVRASLDAGAKNAGQPVPDSNFVLESNKGVPQHTQAYIPSLFSFQYLPVKGASVPAWRVTA